MVSDIQQYRYSVGFICGCRVETAALRFDYSGIWLDLLAVYLAYEVLFGCCVSDRDAGDVAFLTGEDDQPRQANKDFCSVGMLDDGSLVGDQFRTVIVKDALKPNHKAHGQLAKVGLGELHGSGNDFIATNRPSGRLGKVKSKDHHDSSASISGADLDSAPYA